MKNVVYFFCLLLFFGACKKKDVTPVRLIGAWAAIVPDTDLFKPKIEFRKDGIIYFERDCYCSDSNTYEVSGNTIKINFGMARCYPIVDCARPSSAVIVQLEGDYLVIDWIFEPIYSSKNNYQRKYRRL
jgi:hypothetical protein